jgi:NTP pyrophosphatase (non-canonical NTP hydrolase)
MDFNEYQEKANSTAVYPDKFTIIYPALGLAGESGEVCEKIKKWLRDENGEVMSEERRQLLKKEIGDVLWYVASLSTDLGFSMDEIANENIEKLFSRKDRGVLKGSGDNR